MHNNILNIKTTPLKKAIKYALTECKKNNKKLYNVIPNFNENYIILQQKLLAAKNINRIDMPVIDSKDINKFYKYYKNVISNKLNEFFILNKNILNQLIETKLYISDNDSLKGKLIKISVSKLTPTQNEIWLEKIIYHTLKQNKQIKNISINNILIVSKEGNILDGHHRFGQLLLNNPNNKIVALYIPINIEELIKLGIKYSDYIGNEGRQ